MSIDNPKNILTAEQITTSCNALIAFVRKAHGGVTCGELLDALREVADFPVEGDYTLEFTRPNIVLYVEVSAEVAEVFGSKEFHDAFDFDTTSILRYLASETKIPAYPLAKRLPKSGCFKTPHWLPIVWNLRESAKSGAR